VNSAYANLLQCSHFADTCVIAEQNDGITGLEVMGWISAYVPPDEPESLFIWQVAVAQAARGQGLARRMIGALLDRPGVEGILYLTTTVTHDNRASWALFKAVARSLDAGLAKTQHFERDEHFAGTHDTEWLATIGPLSRPHSVTQIRKTQQS
jgi:L-2,4-diaminobutyric acid acetyltransferase